MLCNPREIKEALCKACFMRPKAEASPHKPERGGVMQESRLNLLPLSLRSPCQQVGGVGECFSS